MFVPDGARAATFKISLIVSVATGVSKNARTNRGENKKIFTVYQDKKIEIVPFMFYGASKSYMATQERSSKNILLDENSNPCAWSEVQKTIEQAS